MARGSAISARLPVSSGKGTDRVARSRGTMGRGPHHLGTSLAPGRCKSLTRGTFCASSLPARAEVVTTQLAQLTGESTCRGNPNISSDWRIQEFPVIYRFAPLALTTPLAQ